MNKGALKTTFDAARGMHQLLSVKAGNELHKFFADSALQAVALTGGEASFAKSIFGDEIDTSHVIKHFDPTPTDDDTAARAFGGRMIKFFGLENHSADYSRERSAFKYALFIHEMTHLWQFQHPLENLSRFMRNPISTFRYNYHVAPGKSFRDFSVEQQATIIGDYALQFLFTGDRNPFRAKNGLYVPFMSKPSLHRRFAAQNLDLLQKVVEDRFPEARKTRLAMEAAAQRESQKRRSIRSWLPSIARVST